ncbi:MAG TPA: phosphatase PAP2 family protein [Nitrolancea sp.]|nr:phosphatase PAP2 family protein [Nitrolancea sp.]
MHRPRYLPAQVHVHVNETVRERARVGLLEFALLVTTFMLYFATRGVAAGKEAVAFGHAHTVMGLEQRLGLFREMGIQTVVLTVPAVTRLLNFVYAYTHLTALILFGIWVFCWHHDAYRNVRNTFLVILFTGLAIYIIYPLAPPRLFPYTGFVDTLKLYSGINYDQPSLATLYNPFAAMPSLHVGFAVFVGMGLIRVGKRKLYWIPGIIFPLLMATAVVGTANHYILDALAGTLLTVLAYILVPRVSARLSAWYQVRHEDRTQTWAPTPF